MARSAKETTKALLLHEIERIVAEAQETNKVVHAGSHAGQLLRGFPLADYSLGRIIDEIVLAAARRRCRWSR